MRADELLSLVANLSLVVGWAAPFLVVILSSRAKGSLANPKLGVWWTSILVTTLMAALFGLLREWAASLEIAHFDQDGDGWVDLVDGREMKAEESEAYGLHTGELGRHLQSVGLVIISPFYAIAAMISSVLVLTALRRRKRSVLESKRE